MGHGTAEKMEAKAGEGSKENQDPLPHLPVLSSEPPAVVTTPSATVWTTRMARLSSMAMARCFSDILGDQRISVYLQSVTLDTFYSVVGNSKYYEFFCNLSLIPLDYTDDNKTGIIILDTLQASARHREREGDQSTKGLFYIIRVSEGVSSDIFSSPGSVHLI